MYLLMFPLALSPSNQIVAHCIGSANPPPDGGITDGAGADHALDKKGYELTSTLIRNSPNLLKMISLLVFASMLASLASGSAIPVQIAQYNTTDCTGPVQMSLSTAPAGCSILASPLLINGAPSTAANAQINCPGNTVTYGDTSCNTTVANSAVCYITGSTSYMISCATNACKPESSIGKQRCKYRAAQCGAMSQPMKWYVSLVFSTERFD
jgi:hypothetical protein